MNFKVALLSFFLIFLPSCALAPFVVSPIVTGVIMWKEGEAKKYYKEEYKTIHRAVKISLRDLNYEIKSEEDRKDGCYIVAGTEDKLKIKIVKVKDEITEVKIRINFMGDKPYAELLYAEIDANTSVIEYDQDGKPTKARRRILRPN